MATPFYHRYAENKEKNKENEGIELSRSNTGFIIPSSPILDTTELAELQQRTTRAENRDYLEVDEVSRLQKERDDTTARNKVLAFAEAGFDSSVWKDVGIKLVANARFDEDESWKIDFDTMMTIANQRGLTYDSDWMNKLHNSKSQDEFMYIMNMYEQTEKKRAKVNEELGNVARIAASISGELTHPANLLVPSMFMAKTAKTAIGLSTAYEASYLGLNEAVDRNQDEFMVDKLVQSSGALALEYGLMRMFTVKDAINKGMPLDEADKPLLLEWKPLQPQVDDSNDLADKVFKANIDLENRLKAVSKEVKYDIIEPTKERTWFTQKQEFSKQFDEARKQQAKEMEELDAMIAKAKDFEDNILPARYEQETMYAEMREKAATYRRELEVKLEVMAEKEYNERVFQSQMRELRQIKVNDAIDKLKNNKEIPEEFKSSIIRQLKKTTDIDNKTERLQQLGKREYELNELIGSLSKKISGYKRNTKFKQQAIDDLAKLNAEKKNIQNTTKQIKEGGSVPNKQKAKIKEAEDALMIAGLTLDEIKENIVELRKIVTPEYANVWKDLKGAIDIVSTKYPTIFDGLKQDIGNLIAKGEKAKLNSKILAKLPTSKKLAVVGLAAGLAGTSAQASDGSSSSGLDVDVIAYLVMAIMLPYGVAKFVRNQGFRNRLEAISKNARLVQDRALYKTTEESTKMELVRSKALSFMYSGSLLARYPYIAKFGGRAKETADKILTNPFGKGKYSSELDKETNLRTAEANISIAMRENKELYLQEAGLTSKITNMLNDAIIDNDIGLQVSDVLDGKVSKFKSINNIASAIKNEMDKAIKSMIEAGYETKLVTNYFPRHWNADFIRSAIRLNPKNEDIIAEALSKAIIKGLPEATAEGTLVEAKQILNSLIRLGGEDGKHFTLTDDFLDKIDNVLKKANMSKEEVSEQLTTAYQDMLSSLKSRKDMVIDELNGIKLLDANGYELNPIGKNELLHRNAFDVSKSYLNAVYGQLAMNKAGFKTRRQFIDEVHNIRTEQGNEAADAVKEAGYHIFGISDYKPTSQFDDILKGASLLAIGLSLKTSVFSTATELAKVLVASGFGHNITSFRRVIRGYNDKVGRKLMQESALGTSQIRGKLPERFWGTAEEQKMLLSTDSDGVISGINSVGKWFLGAVVHNMGLGWFSDLAQRINVHAQAGRLARYIESGKVISKERAEYYGLTEEAISTLKGIFELDKSGKVVDMKDMTNKQRETFRGIFRQMTNEATPEVSLGSTPEWMSSELGRIIAPLNRYPINAFNTSGAVDMQLFDSRALLMNFAGIVGTILGLSARAELSQSNMSTEDIIMYSLMSQNPTGIIPIPMSILGGDSSQFGTLDDKMIKMQHEFAKTFGDGNER